MRLIQDYTAMAGTDQAEPKRAAIHLVRWTCRLFLWCDIARRNIERFDEMFRYLERFLSSIGAS